MWFAFAVKEYKVGADVKSMTGLFWRTAIFILKDITKELKDILGNGDVTVVRLLYQE